MKPERITFFLIFTSLSHSALAATGLSKLYKFDFLTLGAQYQSLLQAKAECDRPRDLPNFANSMKLGLSSIVCPTNETFALATLLEDKITSISVNWVSWDKRRLEASENKIQKIPEELRSTFGIPTTTIAYEGRFGNPDADEFCKRGNYSCQIHVWKTENPSRLATLVFARDSAKEIPLLLHISDLEAEQKIEELKSTQIGTLVKSMIQEQANSH